MAVARRLAAAGTLAIWSLLLASPVAAAAEPSPSPTPDLRTACQKLDPGEPAEAFVRLGCDLVTQGPGGPLRDATQSAAQAITDTAEAAFASWLANGAAWVVQRVTDQVTGASTTPNLDPSQAALFAQVYARVVGVALSLSVLLVLIGILEATLTQRPGGLRRVVVGIAVSGIGLGAVPVATAILVRVVDDLSLYVVGNEGQVVAHGFKVVTERLVQASPTEGAAAFALTALGLMVGGALLWLELVTREALIYLFLGVVPLACAAVQWPRLEGVLRQVLFSGLALILSKLVIVIALSVGFAVWGSGVGLENLFAAMFILLVAALTPFALARLLPLAAEELSHSYQGRLRGSITGGVGTAAAVVTAAATAGGSLAGKGMRIAPPLGASPERSGSPSSGSGPGRSADLAAAATGTTGSMGAAPAGAGRRRREASPGGGAPRSG